MYFLQPEILLFSRKSLFPMLTCSGITLFLTTNTSLGLFHCVNPSLSRALIVRIITHLMPLNLVWELNETVILNQILCRACMLIEAFGQGLDTYHQWNITYIVYHFFWGQSKTSLIVKHWQCWKFVLDSHLLHSCHFCEDLAPKQSITTLSKDWVPNVETLSAHISS